MTDDDELCMCFHVTQRKVIQYIRVRKPRRASELSQCYGAGTGCGWCRPFLKRLLEREATGLIREDQKSLPSPGEYARQRAEYRLNQRSQDA